MSYPSFPSYFTRHHKLLKLAAASYVILLILSHATWHPLHVWLIAAVFSIAMNGTYLTEAIVGRYAVKTESIVAAFLVILSILGPIAHPLFVIAAIYSHGLWDWGKHRSQNGGRGVPFVAWYTLSCATVDTLYATSLLLYWITL